MAGLRELLPLIVMAPSARSVAEADPGADG